MSKSMAIHLTRGYIALVDADDYLRVQEFKWHVTIRKTVTYAGRGWRDGKHQRHQYLHRFVLNVSNDVEIDHKDGNGLNCTKKNLRIVTHQQNAMNRGRFAKGYRYHKGRWQAYISINRKQHHLGSFLTEAEAIAAREQAVVTFFGDFDTRKGERVYANME